MTLSSLPLKLIIGIRDFWENEDSDVSRAKLALKKSTGLDVEIEVNWGMIFDELCEIYEDHKVLAASMAGFVTAWLTAFTALVDAEDEAWGDKAVEKVLGISNCLQVKLQVSSGHEHDASTSWNELTGAFTISVPRRQVLFPLESIPIFTRELQQAFGPDLEVPVPESSAQAEHSRAQAESHKLPNHAPVAKEPATAKPHAHFHPNLSLPPPEVLLSHPPFHLTMTSGEQGFIINSSHSPSLVLLEHYLKKWFSADGQHPHKPLILYTRLNEGSFGKGHYDSLTITAHTKDACPLMMVAIIERVLGYELRSSSPGYWTFVRTKEFVH